jgi:hypothetical protein
MTMENVEKNELFVEMAENYRSVKSKVQFAYMKNPKFIEEFADFLTNRSHYQQYTISLQSIEDFCSDLSAGETMRFAKIVTSSEAGNNFLGESDIIFNALVTTTRQDELKVLIPDLNEVKEIAEKHNLEVSRLGVGKNGTMFYEDSIDCKPRKRLREFTIEMIPVANEIIIQTAESKNVTDKETMEIMKVELENLIRKKAEDTLTYRLSFITGDYQIRIY